MDIQNTIALEAEGYFVPIQHFPELRIKIPRGS